MERHFVLPGDPVPQPRPRFKVVQGHATAYTPRSHPVVPYRQGIALVAQAAGVQPLGGSVEIELTFVFARPKSHFTKSGLSSTALPRPRPDWDNLAKAVCDALKGIAYRDDSQVVRSLVVKRYAVDGEEPRTVVAFREVGP